jgi:hypothetical protein
MLGTNPDLVISGDELAAKRAQRAAREQAQAMASAAKPASDASSAAVNLSNIDARQPSALNTLVSTIQPN